MSLPDKCPFCGAEPYTTASGNQCRGGDRWVLFSCGTSIYAGQDLRRTQSRKCEDAERARLAARVAELEAQNVQLQRELDYAKARSKEIEDETLRLEDLAKNRGKLMTQAVDQSRDLEARVTELERELEQAKADRARAAMDARNPLTARLAELEARCKRLEEAGDEMADWNMTAPDLGCDPELLRKWRQAKEARDDEAWASERTVLVEFQPVTSGWYASAPDGVVGINATAPTIHGALRALREKMEARPAEKATPCMYCLRVECECSDADVCPDMGDK